MSWPFDEFVPSRDFDTAEYGRLLRELHKFHGALASAALSRADTIHLREALTALRSRLHAMRTDIDSAPYGQLDDLPCHGLGQLPAWRATHETETTLRATFEFTRWHIGGGGAAHGGMVTAVLDDVMGSCASSRGRVPVRTAYLTTTFRALTPVEVPLDVVVSVTKTEGRKLFVHGEIRHGQDICAEADGLFVIVTSDERRREPARAVTSAAAEGSGTLDGRAHASPAGQAPPMARSCPSQ